MYEGLFSLEGRTALVVGAGSGIGREVSLALAAFGSSVTCADVNAESAAATASMVQDGGGTARAVGIDVCDSKSVSDVAASVETPDTLVITPGVHIRKPLARFEDAEFDRVMSINVAGTFRVMRAFGERMAERGSGSIVTFASIRAHVVEPGQGVYAASKAGVLQMSRALAAELGDRGVRVNAVAPGYVETPLTQHIKNFPEWYKAISDKTALRRWAKPSEIASVVVFLASSASSYVTGSCLFVDGGWTAVDGRYSPPVF
jgi:NAD(P)-dependent dehydrogenase (short-subunit alcohol dehydrogenase family)